MHIAKIAAMCVVGLIVLVIALSIAIASFKSISEEFGGIPGMTAPSYGGGASGGMYAYDDYDASYTSQGAMPEFSARNAASMMPAPMAPSGNMAEAFEVQEYSATIETRKLDETCGAFDDLKKREDVIFESSSSYDRGCNYTFKAEKASAPGVLAWLEDLNPKELSDNTHTIKREVDDFTSEVEVLEKKRASIDSTLSSALAAYDEITRLATNTQNADALAKIIDSRIGIIERLTQERININEQLDRLARGKADSLDRLEYTYFSVNVYENKFVDGEQIKDSWKEAIREFVRDFNEALQGLTVGLLLLLVLIVQWAIYALIVLVIAKYGWKLAKYIWYR